MLWGHKTWRLQWSLLSLSLWPFILSMRLRSSSKFCLNFLFLFFIPLLSIPIASTSTYIRMTPKFSSFLSSFATFAITLIYAFVRMSCQNSNLMFSKLNCHFSSNQLLPVSLMSVISYFLAVQTLIFWTFTLLHYLLLVVSHSSKLVFPQISHICLFLSLLVS